MIKEGVKVVSYASGRHMSVESALLMNLRTGISQTCGELTKQGIIERGVTHVETSAHQGARNTGEGHQNHESWQGRVFYWKEMDKGDTNAEREMFSSKKVREVIEKQTPMNSNVIQKVKESLAKKGWSLEQTEEGDSLLENSGKEGMTFPSGIIILHTKASASGFYEELIHYGQIKANKGTYEPIENTLLEIEAKEKLLKHSTAYNITDYEKELLTDSLEYYRIALETLRKGGI